VKWQQGRETVTAMLRDGQLERVPPSREHADALLDQAQRHLKTAELAADDDPVGSYQLTYDAARKALAAILENQGLRATSRGGHIAVLEAVTAQLDPPLGAVLRPFDRMRRRRNDAEYPRNSVQSFTPQDARRDKAKATEILTLAHGVIDQMSPF
jgi:HEPN domain